MEIEATAVRDGKQQVIPAEQLVPGDIVHLQSGDRVPADLRLVKTRELQVDESALTDVSQLARQGFRVLALASRNMPPPAENLAHEDIASGLTFLGLQAIQMAK